MYIFCSYARVSIFVAGFIFTASIRTATYCQDLETTRSYDIQSSLEISEESKEQIHRTIDAVNVLFEGFAGFDPSVFPGVSVSKGTLSFLSEATGRITIANSDVVQAGDEGSQFIPTLSHEYAHVVFDQLLSADLPQYRIDAAAVKGAEYVAKIEHLVAIIDKKTEEEGIAFEAWEAAASRMNETNGSERDDIYQGTFLPAQQTYERVAAELKKAREGFSREVDLASERLARFEEVWWFVRSANELFADLVALSVSESGVAMFSAFANEGEEKDDFFLGRWYFSARDYSKPIDLDLFDHIENARVHRYQMHHVVFHLVGRKAWQEILKVADRQGRREFFDIYVQAVVSCHLKFVEQKALGEEPSLLSLNEMLWGEIATLLDLEMPLLAED